ncbi:MAG: hypothetical protein B7W98_02510 [Parcubacteria group bacterium 20-58-5]|nr:MAG: hypothetical protein B7W98_02510 [Parcubacteria group bacterium 20-58-5]OYV63039.1 MAG: hypothetical protein B7X03_03370 [Parcubacteria group bacterium 21-58-10]HQT82962.1 hypothetical protein [Candidatus Paceibacterota bacterium]
MDSDTSENGGGAYEELAPRRHPVKHYHGNETRVLFVLSAVVLIVAQSTGADLPLSTTGAVVSAVVLVIAAGITNPAQGWIHWLNTCIALYGTFLFGVTAVDHYRAGMSIFNPSFTYIEALSLLSLIALYFTVRTVRGFHLRLTLS